MKKLLSLLSVLTISGTAVPTIIAASQYPKEEKIKKEILIREKRSLKSLPSRKNKNKNSNTEHDYENSGGEASSSSFSIKNKNNNLGKITKNYLNKKNYLKNINSFLSDNSQSSKKLTSIKNYDNKKNNNGGLSEPTNEDNKKPFRIFGINRNTGKRIYMLKSNNQRKHLNIDLEGSEGKQIIAILNTNNNLYLDGFITGNSDNAKYWHFNNNEQNDDKFIKKIDGIKNYGSLNFGGDYPSLLNNDLNKSIKINKKLINNSIDKLADFDGNNADNLKEDLVRIIFITSESLRFFSIRDKVQEILHSGTNNDKNIKEIDFQDYKENKLWKWDKLSKDYIKVFSPAKKSDRPSIKTKVQTIETTDEINNSKDITQIKVSGDTKTSKIRIKGGLPYGQGQADNITKRKFINDDNEEETEILSVQYDIDDVAILSSGSIGRLVN